MNSYQLYKPVQPGIENFDNLHISYQAAPPYPCLRQYIIHYFAMDTYEKMDQGFTVHCIPDGCVSVMFNKSMSEKLFLAGVAHRPFFEKITTEPEVFGVKFYPGAINSFFSLPSNEIYDNPLPFEEFISFKIRHKEEALLTKGTFQKRIKILEQFLLKQLGHRDFTAPPCLQTSMDAVYRSKGSIRITELRALTNVSDRYLRILFNNQLGMPPKDFIKLIRFQNTFRDLSCNAAKNAAAIALENGYYDQSHFIKEFRKFSGKTPILRKKSA